MLAVGALLIFLSALTVHGTTPAPDSYYYYDYDDDTEDPDDYEYDSGSNSDVIEESSACDSNPCLNGGSCQSKSATEYTCSCPEPYKGTRCEQEPKDCYEGNGESYRGSVNMTEDKEECLDWKSDFIILHGQDPFTTFSDFPGLDSNTKNHCRNPDGDDKPWCFIKTQGKLDWNFCKVKECPKAPAPTTTPQPIAPVSPAAPVASVSPVASVAPVSPASPAAPVSPAAPAAPVAPVAPVSPAAPAAPAAPVVPVAPAAPVAPVAPAAPVAPVAPVSPASPAAPVAPVAPVSPAAPAAPVVPVAPVSPVAPAAPVVPVAPSAPQFSQCGKSQPAHAGRILGGRKSVPGAHPWQVSVQKRTKGSSTKFLHACGGILLKSCWVLTAAHCIDPNEELQVVLGGVNIDKQEEIDQIIPVIEKIIHEDFKERTEALYNDIALLKLQVTDGPYCAKETRYVRAACLLNQPFPAGKECVVSGWGKTENRTYSSHLLNSRVLLISQAQCSIPEIYGNVLNSSMLCAGVLRGGVDSCEGDSGGPLVCEEANTYYVTGVVSWGYSCGVRNKPGVYANVHTFLNWIESRIR